VKYRKALLYAVLTLGVGVVLGFEIAAWRSDDGAYASMQKIRDAFLLIENNYVEEIDSSVLAEAGLENMVGALDPHSVYISKERMESVSESFEASFEGIGISYEFVEGPDERDTIAVMNVLHGGPSEEAGLQSGDRIIAVDDSSAVGFSKGDVQHALRGPRGTQVGVTVLRPIISDTLHFTITRDKIPLRTLDAAYMVGEKTGYVKLNRFARTTHQEFTRAVRELKKKGMERITLDLQGNSGGFMRMAVKVADEFLSGGQTIVSARGRHERFSHVSKSDDGGALEDMPVIVLVDEQSASASEIVAGALQDHDRGLIVGRRTFGKGLVQKQYKLNDGSAVRVTISRFYTPSGRLIQTPYDRGSDEDYFETKAERHRRDAVRSADAIIESAPDSFRYATEAGRTVLGGGGILPDFVVAPDSLSPFARTARGNNLFTRFARRWLDRHGTSLRETWPDKERFVSGFESRKLFDPFLEFAGGTGLRLTNEPDSSKNSSWRAEVRESREQIETLLKAHLGRRLYGSEGWYPVFNTINSTYQEALGMWKRAEKLASS
jgi:carboxyl-terminal processing protease